MRKKVVILAAIVVIIVSVAVTVANLSDGQVDAQRYNGNGITDDIIAQSTISALELTELYYGDGESNQYYFFPIVDAGFTVYFKPEKRPFTLEKVVVDGGYNNETGYLPFALVVSDGNGKTLYQFADMSLAYFYTEPKLTSIDIPTIDMTEKTDDGGFFITLYTRGTISVGADTDKPANTSYIVMRGHFDSMVPAVTVDTEKPLNWGIRAVIGS